jgi:hypothetical protein
MTNAELGIPEYKVRKVRKKKPYSRPDSIKQFEKEYDIWYYSTRKTEKKFWLEHKFDDKTANGLTKLVMAWLKVNGHFAARINSGAIFDRRLGVYRANSGATVGMADINAVVKGKSISIEVKIGKDKIRDSQLKVKSEIEAAGGIYIIVRSFDDFRQQFENIR